MKSARQPSSIQAIENSIGMKGADCLSDEEKVTKNKWEIIQQLEGTKFIERYPVSFCYQQNASLDTETYMDVAVIVSTCFTKNGETNRGLVDKKILILNKKGMELFNREDARIEYHLGKPISQVMNELDLQNNWSLEEIEEDKKRNEEEVLHINPENLRDDDEKEFLNQFLLNNDAQENPKKYIHDNKLYKHQGQKFRLSCPIKRREKTIYGLDHKIIAYDVLGDKTGKSRGGSGKVNTRTRVFYPGENGLRIKTDNRRVTKTMFNDDPGFHQTPLEEVKDERKAIKKMGQIRVKKMEQYGNTYFLTMEKMTGINLLKFRNDFSQSYQKKFPPHQFLYLLIALLRELKKIHDRGYIHLDIKPENIMINPERMEINIIDYGNMVKTNNAVTRKGTPPYIAPEIYNSEKRITQQADIFSMGQVFVALCGTGRDFKEMLTSLQSNLQKRGFTQAQALALRELISSMTNQSPKKRIKINEAIDNLEILALKINHPLFTEYPKLIEMFHKGMAFRNRLQRVQSKQEFLQLLNSQLNEIESSIDLKNIDPQMTAAAFHEFFRGLDYHVLRNENSRDKANEIVHNIFKAYDAIVEKYILLSREAKKFLLEFKNNKIDTALLHEMILQLDQKIQRVVSGILDLDKLSIKTRLLEERFPEWLERLEKLESHLNQKALALAEKQKDKGKGKEKDKKQDKGKQKIRSEAKELNDESANFDEVTTTNLPLSLAKSNPQPQREQINQFHLLLENNFDFRNKANQIISNSRLNKYIEEIGVQIQKLIPSSGKIGKEIFQTIADACDTFCNNKFLIMAILKQVLVDRELAPECLEGPPKLIKDFLEASKKDLELIIGYANPYEISSLQSITVRDYVDNVLKPRAVVNLQRVNKNSELEKKENAQTRKRLSPPELFDLLDSEMTGALGQDLDAVVCIHPDTSLLQHNNELVKIKHSVITTNPADKTPTTKITAATEIEFGFEEVSENVAGEAQDVILPLAKLFVTKSGKAHLVYYPALDSDASKTCKDVSLKSLVEAANAFRSSEIFKQHYGHLEIQEHFSICTYPRLGEPHYVAATRIGDHIRVINPKQFGTSDPDMDELAKFIPIHSEPIHLGVQSLFNTDDCGYHVAKIHGKAAKNNTLSAPAEMKKNDLDKEKSPKPVSRFQEQTMVVTNKMFDDFHNEQEKIKKSLASALETFLKNYPKKKESLVRYAYFLKSKLEDNKLDAYTLYKESQRFDLLGAAVKQKDCVNLIENIQFHFSYYQKQPNFNVDNVLSQLQNHQINSHATEKRNIVEILQKEIAKLREKEEQIIKWDGGQIKIAALKQVIKALRMSDPSIEPAEVLNQIKDEPIAIKGLAWRGTEYYEDENGIPQKMPKEKNKLTVNHILNWRRNDISAAFFNFINCSGVSSDTGAIWRKLLKQHATVPKNLIL